MFSWICPKCGAEVPPSENDCPRCAKVHAIPVPPAQPVAAPAPAQMPPQAPAQPMQPAPYEQQPPQMAYPPQQPYYGQQAGYAPPMQPQQAMPPQQPQYAPPPPLLTQSGPWQAAPAPQQQQSPQQTYQQPQYVPPPAPPTAPPPVPTYMMEAPKSGLPSWLVVLIVAAALIGVGWAGIRFLTPSSTEEVLDVPKRNAEPKQDAKKAAATGAAAYAKYVELTGLRVVENAKKKLEVQMVAVNHSAAELPDLKLRVNLRVSNAPAGKEPISTFTVSVPSLGAFEVRDLKTEAATKLRAYEFPDWQFLRVDFDPVSQ